MPRPYLYNTSSCFTSFGHNLSSSLKLQKSFVPHSSFALFHLTLSSLSFFILLYSSRPPSLSVLFYIKKRFFLSTTCYSSFHLSHYLLTLSHLFQSISKFTFVHYFSLFTRFSLTLSPLVNLFLKDLART